MNSLVVAGKLTAAEDKIAKLEDDLDRLEKAHIALARHVKRMDNEFILEHPYVSESDSNQMIKEYLEKHPEKCVPGGHIRCKSVNPLIIDEEAEENRVNDISTEFARPFRDQKSCKELLSEMSPLSKDAAILLLAERIDKLSVVVGENRLILARMKENPDE